jgi:meiotically up-regulated gene 157 (Mug157) protein
MKLSYIDWQAMAKFHFVEDYERHVEALLRLYPLDEVMSLAVGGQFENVGLIKLELLWHLGLSDNMSVTDLGCGSGRPSNAIHRGDTILSSVSV